MSTWRSILGLCVGFCSTLAIGACTPPSASGNCTVDEDCPSRGQFCETVNNVCMDAEGDYTTTDDDGVAGNFTDKPIPFFRGQVCTAPGAALKAGSPIPLTFRPCLHPCITGGDKIFQHQWSCLSGLCTAMSIFYTEGTGDNCPAEAWGEFPKDQCDYSVQFSSKLGPVELDGNPVEGTLDLEVPFLQNTDMLQIVQYKNLELAAQETEATAACLSKCDGRTGDAKSTCLENCLIKDLAHQYLQQDDRVIPFDMRNSNPEPPDDCLDNPACECFEVGFG